MPEARIVGVAECDIGETGLGLPELQVQAVTRALDDAGLTIADVDGLATNGYGRFPTTLLAEYLGVRPRWTESSFIGGSASVAYIDRAAAAIARGDAEVVVISWVSNQRSAHSRRLGGVVVDEARPDARLEAPFHPLSPISFYAMAAQRHMHEFGTTPEQLAAVAVAAREWALRNPRAFRHDAGPLTVDDVLATPMVSSPLHVADCCLVTDGGGAVVLAAAGSGSRRGVRIIGFGEATTHASMSQAPELVVSGAAESGQRAFAAAGLTPDDVDVAQVYDSFTITVVLSLEGLGFCERGTAGALAESGALAPGGRLPLNTSGGGLSYCHPGQLGVLLVVEAVRQLRGECGARQVPGARVALCHGTGGILSHHATLLLGAA